MTTNRNIYNPLSAVFSGVLSAGLAALILYPIVSVLFDKYFHFMGYPEGHEQRDGLIIAFTLALWFFISSMVGGMICTLIAKNNEWLYVFINMIVVVLILIIISEGAISVQPNLGGILILLMIPFGNMAGKLLGSMIKRKRTKKKEDGSPISNNSSS